MLLCKLQAGTVAAREELVLVVLSSVPDRPDSVEHPLGMELEAWSGLGISGIAAVEFAAGSEKFGTSSSMNGSIDPTAAEQRGVGRIDNGVNSLCCDVSLDRDKFCHFQISGFDDTQGRLDGRSRSKRLSADLAGSSPGPGTPDPDPGTLARACGDRIGCTGLNWANLKQSPQGSSQGAILEDCAVTHHPQKPTQHRFRPILTSEKGLCFLFVRRAGLVVSAAAVLLAGCGGGPVKARSLTPSFQVSSGSTIIDTNCTGCNAVNSRGNPVHRFSASIAGANTAAVTWSVTGGDPKAGAGTISSSGQYTPPNYLTRDRVEVVISAALKSDPSTRAETALTLTPGFLQPLTPQNVALGPGGSVAVTASLAEVGGANEVHFALSRTPRGEGGGEGSLGPVTCQRTSRAFTSCSVTYTAPATVPVTGMTYVVASVPGSSTRTEAAVLLNSPGISSNPAMHQNALAFPMLLGSSGGNNSDFDEKGNTIVDCCSGTLGALVKDDSGREYLLSNNHVLARSDHASVGDTIVQPGLIDNNCTPNGDGPGTVPVAALTAWLPLYSAQTNADAAIAQIASHTVDTTGSILEMGVRQRDGSLGSAPPGISSSNGRGESATLQLRVAKSGRTTGLTCGRVTTLDLDVAVDYYRDCAETQPYLTKTFTGQIAVGGDHFTDAGDSGALVVDSENAEPVGLFFAGGIDGNGVSHAIASPAGDVLDELSAQIPGGASLAFVGAAEHQVSCLSYGDNTISAAQAKSLSDAEIARQQQAVSAGRAIVNPSAGILGVAAGKSTDQPGSAGLVVYIDKALSPAVPAELGGVRTIVVPATARAVALGSAPLIPTTGEIAPLSATALSQAISIKRQVAHRLMQQNPAFFGIGLGQSLDDPREAAMVIYVDRDRMPSHLPGKIGGLRTRYIVMNRLHVTRSYEVAGPFTPHCTPHQTGAEAGDLLTPPKIELP
jgi:hypothetical protein